MKGKKLLSVLMAIALTGSLAACGKTADTAKPAETKGEISGEITVWSWNVAAKALQVSADAFTKKYPKAKVTVVDGGGNAQVYDKLTVGLQSKTGLPDVISVEGQLIPSYVSKFPDGFVDLTAAFAPEKDNFLAAKVGEVTLGGKVWAFPWDAAPAGIFYRTDMFEKYGVKAEDIKTWDDYIKAGKQIVEKSGGKVKMLNLNEKDDDPQFRMMINQLGTFYFDKDGKPVLNGPEAVKAMTVIKNMVDSGVAANLDWDGTIAACNNDTIASVPFGVWWLGTLQSNVKDKSGKWAAMRMPAFEAGGKTACALGGSTVMVPSTTKNKDLAVAFAKFAMTDKESIMKSFKDYGLYPSYIPCFSDPMFNEKVEYCGGQQVWKLFSEIGKEMPAMNFTENYQETQVMVKDTQAKILLDKNVKASDIQGLMDKLQNEVKAKIGK